MRDCRYQIFVSSTFRDLQDARQQVQIAIQRINFIPAGMEFFPSANDAPWDVIARIVEDSDYYVLIVGGRYGSVDENGISFTEREYDLAVQKRIPVLAFLHLDPGKLPAENCDMNGEAQTKLENFRTKIRGAHHCLSWYSAEDLATKVIVSLVNEIVQNPRPGWTRGNFAENQQQLLSTLEQVRGENDELRRRIVELDAEAFKHSNAEEISQGADSTKVTLREWIEKAGQTEGHYVLHEVETTWHDLFMAIAWDAVSGADTSRLRSRIARTFHGKWSIDDDQWQTIATQFLALGLLIARQELRPTSGFVFGESSSRQRMTATELWYLTEKGLNLFSQTKALKREQLDSDRESKGVAQGAT